MNEIQQGYWEGDKSDDANHALIIYERIIHMKDDETSTCCGSSSRYSSDGRGRKERGGRGGKQKDGTVVATCYIHVSSLNLGCMLLFPVRQQLHLLSFLGASSGSALTTTATAGFILTTSKSVNQIRQRCHLSLVHQVELFNEIEEVLEACIQMCFFSQRDDFLEMGVVDMSVDSKEALEDLLHYSNKVLREGCV